MNNIKIGIKRGNSYRKNEVIQMKGTKKSTQKLNLYVLTLMNVFLNQKRINVCEQIVNIL